jgi:hypothetical protein
MGIEEEACRLEDVELAITKIFQERLNKYVGKEITPELKDKVCLEIDRIFSDCHYYYLGEIMKRNPNIIFAKINGKWQATWIDGGCVGHRDLRWYEKIHLKCLQIRSFITNTGIYGWRKQARDEAR